MKMSAKLEGIEDAMRALQAAFPDDWKKQAQIVNSAMGGSSRKTLLPIAKQLAKRGSGSGALSESLGVRAQKARKRYGKAGGMEIVPVRYDKKAIMKYLQHYYIDKGKNPPLGGIDGIRHGHLVEFGVPSRGIPAAPFLWPAATSGSPAYRAMFADVLKKRIASSVKREARKKAKKK